MNLTISYPVKSKLDLVHGARDVSYHHGDVISYEFFVPVIS